MNTDERMAKLIGRTITNAAFFLNECGYQVFKIQLDDGTLVEAWENAQAGDMMLSVDADQVEPSEY